MILLLIGVSTILVVLLLLKTPPCANAISCTKDLSGNINTMQVKGEFMGKSISLPSNYFQKIQQKESVLGITSENNKKIFVNLSNQHLYAYEGEKLIYDFVVSTGRWNPTPLGKFYIWEKLLATHMEGGDKGQGTYYNLPNVPYTMYFYNENIGKEEGYGIHGDYWQKAFGYPATFGCIGMKVDDVKRLYYWTNPFPVDNATMASAQNPGTPVIIFGKTPL